MYLPAAGLALDLPLPLPLKFFLLRRLLRPRYRPARPARRRRVLRRARHC